MAFEIPAPGSEWAYVQPAATESLLSLREFGWTETVRNWTLASARGEVQHTACLRIPAGPPQSETVHRNGAAPDDVVANPTWRVEYRHGSQSRTCCPRPAAHAEFSTATVHNPASVARGPPRVRSSVPPHRHRTAAHPAKCAATRAPHAGARGAQCHRATPATRAGRPGVPMPNPEEPKFLSPPHPLAGREPRFRPAGRDRRASRCRLGPDSRSLPSGTGR
ncbi:hypothetical protein BH23GEM9_BH23GEM9_26440 [soil metagenome]